MTRELVFLLEEPSAGALLESLLPRLLDSRIMPRMIPFEGKQDLEKHLVRRVRGYQNPQARFIVLRDQDSHPDCIELKQRLSDLCNQSGKMTACLVRIACRELETFYLADLAATEIALGLTGLARQQGSRKFRAPDYLGSPSRELNTLTRGKYQKVGGSREIGKHLDLNNQRSVSFQKLVVGIQRMEAELLV